MTDHAASNLPLTSPNSGTAAPRPAGLSPRLEHELSKLGGDIDFNPVKNYTHHTWAQTFFSRPEYYFQPTSVPELQKIITLARRTNRRVCVTGYGHSPSTLTLTSSWLINLDRLSAVLAWDVDGKPGHVRFQAGISLHDLNLALATRGFTLPNLGSIDVQSIAGAISTGTHGSSLSHGLLSQNVTSLTILLSNSQLVTCSASKNPSLFRAALLSLGSLGIIVEMSFQSVPDFNISWNQRLLPIPKILSSWSESWWKEAEYRRVWWCPYLHRAVVWSANREDIFTPRVAPASSFYGGKFGFYLYHNLLALSNTFPRILPWVEWLIFGLQYGFTPEKTVTHAIEPAREGLRMDCLYSQWVNEWALPLSKGPEAITRLSAWINHRPLSEHNIPFSSKGIWVHCPIEVRVSATHESLNTSNVTPYLDPTCRDEPTLYLNATLYRPYGRDPPCRDTYYAAFEHLMRELGGRPHWAKNFLYTSGEQIESMYSTPTTTRADATDAEKEKGGDSDLTSFLRVREECDPDGMFLGEWHLTNLPSVGNRKMVEREVGLKKMGRGYGDGKLWFGEGKDLAGIVSLGDTDEALRFVDEDETEANSGEEVSMRSHTSEESFDLMNSGEASVLGTGEKGFGG